MLIRFLLLLVPVTLATSVLLNVTRYSDHDSAFQLVPIDIDQVTEGDEELLLAVGALMWILAGTYLLAARFPRTSRGTFAPSLGLLAIAVATALCSRLEYLWRPHNELGNIAVAIAMTLIYLRCFRLLLGRARSSWKEGIPIGRGSGP